MSVIYPVIFRVIAPVIGNPFGLPVGGGVTVAPPVSDELLVWLKGDNTDDGLSKVDSWEEPDREDFSMSGGACATLNGTDEFGTLDSTVTLVGDFEISFRTDNTNPAAYFLIEASGVGDYLRVKGASTYWRISINGVSTYFYGLAFTDVDTVHFKREGNLGTLTVSGVSVTETVPTDDFTVGEISTATYSVEGELYNLRLKDSTQDIHFRLQENSGLTSFSDDYDTDGHYIAWTAVEEDLWAGSQDSYFGNSGDWWEIDGDPVMYPYPVAGFDTFHKGGTLNNSEVSMAPEEFPVGTFNGVDDWIGTTLRWESTFTTVSFYMEPNGSGTEMVLSSGYFGNGGWYLTLSYETNNIDLRVSVSGSTVSLDMTVPQLTDSRNVSITFTEVASDNYDITFTVDGQSVSSNLDMTIPTTDVQIGTYQGLGSYMFTGIIRDVNINGTLIQINEGTGTDIHSPSFGDLDKENLLQWSEDFSNNTVWVRSDCSAVANNITCDTEGDSYFYQNTTVDSGDSVIARVGVQGVSGSIGKTIYLRLTGGANEDLPIVLTDEVVWYSLERISDTSNTLYVISLNDGVTSNLATGDSILCYTQAVKDNAPYIKTEDYTYKLGYGRSVGELNGDESFWAGEPMVSKALMDAEAAQDTKYFCDGLGHALPMTQEQWGELGEELVTNGEFIYGSDGWSAQAGWSFGVEATCDGSQTNLSSVYQSVGLQSGLSYKITFNVTSRIAGSIRTFAGGVYSDYVTALGFHTVQVTTTDANPAAYIQGDIDFIGSIDNISVREVNQVMNKNNQYYLSDGVLPWNTLGDELVVNGDFEDGSDDWAVGGTNGTNTAVFATDVTLTADGSTFLNISQGGVFTVGVEYEVTFSATDITGAGWKVQDGVTDSNITTVAGDGFYKSTFIANDDTILIGRASSGSASGGTFDNISVKEILSSETQSDCTDAPQLKIYKEPLTFEEDAEVKRGDLCGTFKGCDDVMLIGSSGTAYGYFATTGNLYIREFEGGLIGSIYADTADDGIVMEMASGFIPTLPYLELTVGGNPVILTYDEPSHKYTGTDATLAAYLSGNVGGSTCISFVGKSPVVYNVVEGFNVVHSGNNVTNTGSP